MLRKPILYKYTLFIRVYQYNRSGCMTKHALYAQPLAIIQKLCTTIFLSIIFTEQSF